MLIRKTAFILAALLMASPSYAELRHVEIKTLGMDWETCAHAVRVAMSKIDGVDKVEVRLNDGLTILDLKPGNRVTVERVRRTIRNNGFVPKDTTVTAAGTAEGDAFRVSGTNELLKLTGKPQPTGDGQAKMIVASK